MSKIYEEALAIIMSHGNILTDNEKQALKATADLMEKSLADPTIQQKVAVPLPTGFGKSTLIKAAIKLIHQGDITGNMLVCVSSDTEVNELIRDLGSMCVSPGTVGVHMGPAYKHGEWDVPKEYIKYKKVLIITHNRIYSNKSYRIFSDYCKTSMGSKRMVCWDESAQTITGTYITKRNLVAQIGWYLDDHGKHEELQRLYDVLITDYTGGYDLPVLSLVNSKGMPDLKLLTDNSGNDISIQQGVDGIIVKATVKIPDDFNCIIFDASAAITEVAENDPTIELFDVCVSRDYSRSKILCIHSPAGRYTLGNDSALMIQIEEVKRLKGEHRNGLVLTLKAFNRNGGGGSLQNPAAEISRVMPGIKTITWGRERGINEFSELDFVANIGLNYRREDQLISDLVATGRDVNHEVVKSEVTQYQKQLFLGELYQGLSRCCIRKCVDGVAEAATLVIIDSKAEVLAKELRDRAFPGIQIEVLTPPAVAQSQIVEKAACAEKVVRYLTSLDCDKIAIRKLKKSLNLTTKTRRQWDNIKQQVIDNAEFVLEGWSFEGRSLVRMEANKSASRY